jgi:hypothetical protein
MTIPTLSLLAQDAMEQHGEKLVEELGCVFNAAQFFLILFDA